MPTAPISLESPIALTEHEREQARALARALPQFIEVIEREDGAEVRLQAVRPSGEAGMELAVSPGALVLLHRLLTYMSANKPVELIPAIHELTTQEAADLLNVSRPYLVQLLEKGKIKFRKVGPRRRILFEDLMQYKEQEATHARKELTELATDEQRLGLGD